MTCKHERTVTIGSNVWCKTCGNILNKPQSKAENVQTFDNSSPKVEEVKVITPPVSEESETKTFFNKKKKKR